MGIVAEVAVIIFLLRGKTYKTNKQKNNTQTKQKQQQQKKHTNPQTDCALFNVWIYQCVYVKPY